MKQDDIEGSFELLNLPTQRRLRHPQALSGAAKVEFFGYGDETTNLVESKHDAFRESRYAL